MDLGKNLTSIGPAAFAWCTSLGSITLPDTVTNIEDGMVELGGGIGAFTACTGLTNVTIGNNVTNIGDYAFKGCTNLSNIIIPDGVVRIGESAFLDCVSLASLTIPKSVTRIEDGNTNFLWFSGVFSDCTSLTAISVDALNLGT